MGLKPLVDDAGGHLAVELISDDAQHIVAANDAVCISELAQPATSDTVEGFHRELPDRCRAGALQGRTCVASRPLPHREVRDTQKGHLY